MKPRRGRYLAWVLVAPLAGIDGIAWAGAGRLGGGGSPDVSPARILAALVICIIIAFLAVLLVRHRGGRISLVGLRRRMEFGPPAIEVVETRRLSQYADACLIRHDDQEYLLLLQARGAHVLSAKSLAAPPDTEPGSPCG